MKDKKVSELLHFIDKSPSAFHVIDNIKKNFLQAGFIELQENENWDIKKGGNYFTTRNMSSIIAFKMPEKDYIGFNIVASHSDSPMFKIKENPEITVNGEYITLNTESYGGSIMSTWLDRPLSIAGRVVVKEQNKYTTKLVNIDKDLLIIPNVAIHMDRKVNDGKTFNPQIDMLPLLGDIRSKDKFMEIIADNISEKPENIISTDLFLYNRQKGCFLGANEEFIASAKLDDLQCVFASMEGFMQGIIGESVSVFAVFDNEEVGSGTKQGAASTLLSSTLQKINESSGKNINDYYKVLSNSFMISADNAHAVHPNFPSLADPTNKPYINKGIVIKYNANQRYTSDAVSSAIFKGILNDIKIPFQTFANRSDIAGGSTLGNISNTQVALNTVDIGLPQLSMHSCFETAGVQDTIDFINVCKAFYGLTIKKESDESYTIM